MIAQAFRTLVALAVVGLGACAQSAPGHAPTGLILEKTIPLKGVAGRIDHLAIDPHRHRVFVAELGAGAVEAIDLTRGVSLGRISGLKQPQGVAYLPRGDEVAVACGGDGTVRFYRAADLAPTGMVVVGGDADNLHIDGAERLVAGYGDGALAMIDPAARKRVAGLALPAHPEGFQLDGQHVYVNVPDAGQIVGGDLATGRITRAWRAPYAWNFPMAFAPASRTLAVVYRLPPRLRLLDVDSGAVTLDRSTCGDADDVFFDRVRRRIYVICGAGAVDVVDLGHLDRSARIRTRPGARTGLFIPQLDRLIVVARAEGNAAALLIYRPTP